MAHARELRTKLDWSQKDLAEFLGCDQATVSRIETGQPPSGPIERLLGVLERDINEGRVKPARAPAPAESAL